MMRNSESRRSCEVRKLRSRVIPLATAEGSTSSDVNNQQALRGKQRKPLNTARAVNTRNAKARARTRAEDQAKVPSTARTRASNRSARMSLPSSSLMPRRVLRNEHQVSVAETSSTSLQNCTSVRPKNENAIRRNRQQEQVKAKPAKVPGASNQRYKCRNQSSELEVGKYRDLLSACPLGAEDQCRWHGLSSEIVDHILKQHRLVSHNTGPSAKIVLENHEIASPHQWITLQTCLGQTFIVTIKKMEENKAFKYLGTIQVFGQQEVADRFEYSMTLKTSEKSNRMYTYSTVVRPFSEKDFQEGDYFSFSSSYADIFSSKGPLAVEVSISVN